MKHWHKCERWSDLKMPCPFASMDKHEETREVDHKPPVEIGKPIPVNVAPTPQVVPPAEGVGVPARRRGRDVFRVLENLEPQLQDTESDEPFPVGIPIVPPLKVPLKFAPGRVSNPRGVRVREPARVPAGAKSAKATAKSGVQKPSLVSALQSTAGRAIKQLYQQFDESAEIGTMEGGTRASKKIAPNVVAAAAEKATAQQIRSETRPGRAGQKQRPVRSGLSRAMEQVRGGRFTPRGSGFRMSRPGIRGSGGGGVGFMFNAAARMNRLIGRIQ